MPCNYRLVALLVLTDVHIGDSISVNGVCLTVAAIIEPAIL